MVFQASDTVGIIPVLPGCERKWSTMLFKPLLLPFYFCFFFFFFFFFRAKLIPTRNCVIEWFWGLSVIIQLSQHLTTEHLLNTYVILLGAHLSNRENKTQCRENAVVWRGISKGIMVGWHSYELLAHSFGTNVRVWGREGSHIVSGM